MESASGCTWASGRLSHVGICHVAEYAEVGVVAASSPALPAVGASVAGREVKPIVKTASYNVNVVVRSNLAEIVFLDVSVTQGIARK